MLQNALTGEPPVCGGVEPCPVPTSPYRGGLICSQRNLDKSDAPTVRVTDAQGQVYNGVTLVQVFDRLALDTQLQAVWDGFKDAVRAGDLTQAAEFLHSDTRDAYQEQLALLNPATLANVDQTMTTIDLVEVGFGGAQYEMLRVEGGQARSFAVWFQIDEDGLWRLRRF